MQFIFFGALLILLGLCETLLLFCLAYVGYYLLSAAYIAIWMLENDAIMDINAYLYGQQWLHGNMLVWTAMAA